MSDPIPEPIPEFRTSSRNGAHWVDVLELGTRRVPAWRLFSSPIGPFTSKKVASAVADALSAAYRMGSEQNPNWVHGPLGSYPQQSAETEDRRARAADRRRELRRRLL